MIKRWHRILKSWTLLENYYLPGDLDAQIEAYVDYYNYHRYHESINNPTPAGIYIGRRQINLLEREKSKRKTIEHWR